MSYYLEGIDWTARQAITTTTDLLNLFKTDRERISRSYGRLFAYDRQLEIINRTGDELPAGSVSGTR
jgi:hypothetical protein